MSYEVHCEVFDGPFALLLQLITAQQVDLYEVRLTDIIDGFLAECARLEAIDLEATTEFLLIAATLIELKIRRLLPGSDDVALDEELALFEARDYLLARLVECKTFSGAASALAALEENAARSLARRSGPDERFAEVEPDLLAEVSPQMLCAAMRRALAGKPPPPPVGVSHLHVDEVSVAATLQGLRRRLPGLGRVGFRDLTADAPSQAHVVACFLALLELFKRELVELEQPSTFGELRVAWTGGSGADEEDDLLGEDEAGTIWVSGPQDAPHDAVRAAGAAAGGERGVDLLDAGSRR